MDIMNTDSSPLVFALHCHQPLGNFPEVFQEITEKSYRPFLEKFHEYSNAGSMGLHVSGILLEWWSSHTPQMIDLIGEEIENERIELICAGHYEPILTLIPHQDRRGQVEKHMDYIETLFEVRPRGLWLTERIWQPELPEDLAPIGIEYTFVDDFHFRCAGWELEELGGHYTTESNGHTVGIFPINQKLRYQIPFHDVERIKSYLDAGSGKPLTMADDGEKFGSWPDTHQWVYEDGWIDRFFTSCEAGEIELINPGQAWEREPSGGICYLPTSSYQEMLEWSLPANQRTKFQKWKQQSPEDAEQFGRGGFFNHFLVKYEESNRLHKRFQWLSRQIDHDNQPTARDSLWASQCNDSLWHGVFGGLFLPHLRSAVWKQLCRSYRESQPGPDEPVKLDYDRDGEKEIIFGDEHQFFVIDPTNGGELITWELYPPGRNVLDTLTRRWEPYLTKESDHGRDDKADVDTIHHRKTEVPSAWLEGWAEDPVPRAGFQPVSITSESADASDLLLNRNVQFLLRGQLPQSVRIEENTIRLHYHKWLDRIEYQVREAGLTWRGMLKDESEDFWGCSFTFGFRSADQGSISHGNKSHLPTNSNTLTTDHLVLEDPLAEVHLEIKAGQKITIGFHPIETISRSEKQAEKIYQGTAFYFLTRTLNLTLETDWNRHGS